MANTFEDDYNIWDYFVDTPIDPTPSELFSFSDPTLLITIYDVQGETLRYSSRDLYVLEGMDDVYYTGNIVNHPQIEETLADIYFGSDESSDISVEFSNIDNNVDDTWDDIIITSSEDLRGKHVQFDRYDPVDGKIFLARGIVQGYIVGDKLYVNVSINPKEILDTVLSKAVVNTDIFDSTAYDVGAHINICFGDCRNVNCPNIKVDTTNNHYDYLIGYGPIKGIWGQYSSGKGVRRNGILVLPKEYQFYDGSQSSPYPGYAFLRFSQEQLSTDNTPANITADVRGLLLYRGMKPERNYATIMRHLLMNSVWGLGENANRLNFYNMMALLDNISDEDGALLCDGAISTQTVARDIISDFLFICRQGKLVFGKSSYWELSIPDSTNTTSVLSLGDNDGYYNNCNVEEVSVDDTLNALRTARVQYALDEPANRVSGANGYTIGPVDVHTTFGVNRIFQLNFVREHGTARKVLSYLKNRSLYGKLRVTLKCDYETRNIKNSDIITLFVPRRNINGIEFKVHKYRRTLTGLQIEAYQFSSNIYDSISISELPDPAEVIDAFSNVGNLQEATISSGSIDGVSIGNSIPATYANVKQLQIDGVDFSSKIIENINSVGLRRSENLSDIYDPGEARENLSIVPGVDIPSFNDIVGLDTPNLFISDNTFRGGKFIAGDGQSQVVFNILKTPNSLAIYSGFVSQWTVSATCVNREVGQLMCMNGSGELIEADADDVQKNYPIIGLLLSKDIGSYSSLILEDGYFYDINGAWTIQDYIYMSDDPTTTLGLTNTSIDTVGAENRILGYVVSTQILRFNSKWDDIGLSTSWSSYIPSYGASGSMTFSAVTTDAAQYKIIGKTLFLNLTFLGTTGGTADLDLTVTLPDSNIPSSILYTGTSSTMSCIVYDAGGFVEIGRVITTSLGLSFRRVPNGSNFTLGASCGASVFMTIELE